MTTRKNADRTTVLTIRAGAGGVDAEEWTGTLVRMYIRWAQRRGWRAEVVNSSETTGGRVRHATLLVGGPGAEIPLGAEAGIHRLVHRSPYSKKQKRHTAFASVGATPEPTAATAPKPTANELRIDTFSAGGAGGQHVNRTSSAVRITHIPSGTVATSQSERSQISNRKTAMRVLIARLAQQEKTRTHTGRESTEAGFGQQRRSYTKHPYSMVNDHRTGRKTSQLEEVLDGGLELVTETT